MCDQIPYLLYRTLKGGVFQTLNQHFNGCCLITQPLEIRSELLQIVIPIIRDQVASMRGIYQLLVCHANDLCRFIVIRHLTPSWKLPERTCNRVSIIGHFALN